MASGPHKYTTYEDAALFWHLIVEEMTCLVMNQP